MTDSLSKSMDPKRAVRTETLWQWYGLTLKLLLAALMVSIVAVEVLAVTLLMLAVLLRSRGVTYRRTPFDLPVLAFVLVRVLGVVFSTNLGASITTLSREIPYYALYYCMAYYIQHVGGRELYGVLRWLFIATAVVALVSSGQVLLHVVERGNGFTGGGTMSAHITMACAALVAFSAWKLFGNRYIVFGLLLAFLVGQIYTYTRGEWIATASVLIIYYSVFNKKIMAGLALIAVIAILALPSVRDRLMTLAHPLENTSDRLTLWNNALSHAGEHPVLGFGPETFEHVFSDQERMGDKHVGSWHNDWIQTYMETGLLGVASLAWLLFTLGYQSIRLLMISPHKCDPDEPLNATGWMGVLLIVSYLIGGMFSVPTYSITNGILFRFLLAVVGTASLMWPVTRGTAAPSSCEVA